MITKQDLPQQPILRESRGAHYYRSADPNGGPEMPSATTILGVLNKGGLMQWAAKLTREQFIKNQQDHKDMDPATWLEDAMMESERVRDAAAILGSKVHAVIESRCNNTTPPADVPPEAVIHIAYAMTFLEQHHLTPIYAEYRIMQQPTDTTYGMIKQHPGFGGTIDLIAYDVKNECYCVVDWKTGNSKQDTHLTQVAAYAHALNEIIQIEKAYVVYTGKQTFTSLDVSQLLEQYEKFRMIACAYHSQRKRSKVYY